MAPLAFAPASSIDEVLALYLCWGEGRYDEELSQSAHAAQVAAHAVAEGADDAAVAAALLHDVGHLLVMAQPGDATPTDDVDVHHELLGARYLTELFAPEVTRPIALHVQAKRYRCTVDPSETERLSAGSRASLVQQGGLMSSDEAARFARLPAAPAAVDLRRRDDAGKDLTADPPSVTSYRRLLERVARA